MKIYISPSREYYPAPTIPLAEMQPKYCIPASGGFVIISVHRPRERRCTWKFTFPPRGNTIQRRQFRLRKCNQNIASPRAEMHMKIYISPSREYYPAPTIPLAEVQPKYCIPASGGLLSFQFLSLLEEMHRKLCIPASGNAKRMLHLRFAECKRMCAVPQVVLHIKRSKKIVPTSTYKRSFAASRRIYKQRASRRINTSSTRSCSRRIYKQTRSCSRRIYEQSFNKIKEQNIEERGAYTRRE